MGDRQAAGETYLHRVGRTGRFGMKGVAVSLLAGREVGLFDVIRDRYGITATDLAGNFELVEEKLKKARKPGQAGGMA